MIRRDEVVVVVKQDLQGGLRSLQAVRRQLRFKRSNGIPLSHYEIRN